MRNRSRARSQTEGLRTGLREAHGDRQQAVQEDVLCRGDPRTMLENRVPIRPRSSMIREITGMLVHASAAAKTITSAVWSLALPSSASRSSASAAAMPAVSGITVLVAVMMPAVLTSAPLGATRSSTPATNIRRISPSS